MSKPWNTVSPERPVFFNGTLYTREQAGSMSKTVC